MCEPSQEVREQQEADAAWMAAATDMLGELFLEAMSRPPGYQAYFAGLMDGHARRLLRSAYGGTL